MEKLSKKNSHFVPVCSSSKCMSSIIVIGRLLIQLTLNVILKTRRRVLHIRSRILNQPILNCTFCISSFSLSLPLSFSRLCSTLVALHIILTYKYDTNHCVPNGWWSFCWPIHLVDGSYCSWTHTHIPHHRSGRIKIEFKPKKKVFYRQFTSFHSIFHKVYMSQIKLHETYFCFLLHNILKCCCFHEILLCDRRSLTLYQCEVFVWMARGNRHS